MKPSEMRHYLADVNRKAGDILNAINELRQSNASTQTMLDRVAELIGELNPVVLNVGKIAPGDVVVCCDEYVARALHEKYQCFAIVDVPQMKPQ